MNFLNYIAMQMELIIAIVIAIATVVLAVSTAFLARYTNVLANHTKQLNEREKKERTRSDLSRAVEIAEKVILIPAQQFARNFPMDESALIKRLCEFSRYINDVDTRRRLREFVNLIEAFQTHTPGHSYTQALSDLRALQVRLQQTAKEWRDRLNEL